MSDNTGTEYYDEFEPLPPPPGPDQAAVSPHGSDVELTPESGVTATTTDHVPGTPLETTADAEARESFEAESEDWADTGVEGQLPEGRIDTRSPEGAVLTRSNIVSAGPGSAGYDTVRAVVREEGQGTEAVEDQIKERLAEAAGHPVDLDTVQGVKVADARDYPVALDD